MSARKLLVALVVLASTLLIASVTSGAQGAGGPAVEAARQVSDDPRRLRAHAIPRVAVDPRNPDVVAVASGEAYSSSCGVRVSTDGGLSWVDAATAQPPGYPRCLRSNQGSVAGLGFGSDGTLFFAFAGLKPGEWQSRIFVARSTDLGASWQTTELPGLEPDFAKHLSGSHGLPTLVVDPANAERVFVGWQTNYNLWLTPAELPDEGDGFDGKVLVSSSTDGGKTFSAPVDLGADLDVSLVDVHLAMGDAGQLYAFFGDSGFAEGEGDAPPDGHLYAATSTDGGRSFTRSTIATRPGANGMVWIGSAVPAVDPRSGTVYVVFEDMGPNDPAVVVSRSKDDGKTWSKPVAVSTAKPARKWDWPTMLPSLQVAPNGRVDVAWYGYSDDVKGVQPASEEPTLQDVYYSFSTDGGSTWTKNLRVNDRVIDRTIGVASGNNDINGPVGLASRNDMALIAWDDSRNGNPDTQSQDVYFTRARLSGANESGTGSGDGSRLLWGSIFGVGLGLALSGAALVMVASRRASSSVSGSGG